MDFERCFILLHSSMYPARTTHSLHQSVFPLRSLTLVLEWLSPRLSRDDRSELDIRNQGSNWTEGPALRSINTSQTRPHMDRGTTFAMYQDLMCNSATGLGDQHCFITIPQLLLTSSTSLHHRLFSRMYDIGSTFSSIVLGGYRVTAAPYDSVIYFFTRHIDSSATRLTTHLPVALAWEPNRANTGSHGRGSHQKINVSLEVVRHCLQPHS